MTEPSSNDNGVGRRLVTLALLSTLTYAALIIAVFGVLSLLWDRDVVEGEHSILLGMMMPIASITVVGIACLRGAQLRLVQLRSRTSDRRPLSLVPSALAGVLAWAAFAVAGGLLVATQQASFFAGVLFAGERLVDPFTVAAGVCAWAVVLVCSLLFAAPNGDGRGLRWPWEDESDG